MFESYQMRKWIDLSVSIVSPKRQGPKVHNSSVTKKTVGIIEEKVRHRYQTVMESDAVQCLYIYKHTHHSCFWNLLHVRMHAVCNIVQAHHVLV